jgi:outer membrane protein with beta-barrel domain
MRRCHAVVALLMVFTVRANAQFVPRANVFVGYSYASVPQDGPIAGRSGLNGWNGSVEFKVAPWLGGVADFGGLYGTRIEETPCPPGGGGCGPVGEHAKLHTFLFGPRLSVGARRFRLFGHGLFGVALLDQSGSGFTLSKTAFAAALGGGLDYRLAHRLSWRVQGDDLATTFTPRTLHSFRLSTGLVFRF